MSLDYADSLGSSITYHLFAHLIQSFYQASLWRSIISSSVVCKLKTGGFQAQILDLVTFWLYVSSSQLCVSCGCLWPHIPQEPPDDGRASTHSVFKELAAMGKKKWKSFKLLTAILLLSASIFWLTTPLKTIAQDDESQAGSQPSASKLIISSSDASSAPTIVLRTYGIDDQGNRLDLTTEMIAINHGGQAVSDVDMVSDYKAGTFTLFLVDTPPGVEAQMPAIQEAIEQFTSPPEMEEPVDYVSIYQVGESEAVQLLPPTNFFNSIRNFFATPMETQSGPTALADSLGTLLEEAETLKPKDDLVVSIVVLTDGTDVVSTSFQPDELGQLAADLDIPVHTIWLENENLQSFSQQAGQEYLVSLAAESRGVSARLDQPDQVQAIWNRIGDFRLHDVFQYRPEELAGGTFDVTISLRENPDVQATTSVVISTAAPTVAINLPAESRQLTLENLEEPVDLSFSTEISWLDGTERAIESAQLIVNGVVVQEIDVSDIDRFTAEISNFNYGPNTVQVAILDEQGLRATSPEITLTVLQGETAVPEDIEASGFFNTRVLSLVGGCFLLLFLLVALILLILAIRRRRASDYKEPEIYAPDARQPQPEGRQRPAEKTPAVDSGQSYLEILQSVTRMPPAIALSAIEHRIGRNPNQSDIVFENDITISRLHAIIVLEGSDYRIYDEGSTSGTWVNGQPVPEYGSQLFDGDNIQLGDVIVRYRRV